MNERTTDIITDETISRIIEEMKEKGKMSIIYKDEPKIILLDLPARYKGDEELHEEEDDFYVILEGEATLTIADEDNSIRKGDMIHIPAGTTHTLKETVEGIRYIVVKVKNCI
ncbi:cupin domain-containing protein [Candidatus Woesearchaeota archaeon]|nr:cupin domain-containing protein [Candidatus Woesearchaeota archaeon]